MTIRKSYDVLIVGARCAGAATAMLMARYGLRVLAIDRGAYGSDTISTHALMRGGVLQLSRWGVLPRLQEVNTPAIRSTSFHYDNELLDIAIQPSHGLDALYAPRRALLDSVLVDAAQESGAVIRHGYTLVDLIRGFTNRVCGAIIADPGGNLLQVKADLVVGADGVGSTVARLAGAEITHAARYTTGVVFGYFSGIKLTGYHWYYKPGVAVGAIPTNHGQHCVFVSVPPNLLRSEPWRLDRWAAFRRTVSQVSPELGEAIGASGSHEPLRVFSGFRGFLRQSFGPGWALVGDAGYFKDPLTAHGITDALRDAELLARATVAGTSRDLSAYVETRDALSVPLFQVTDEIASFDWDLERLRDLHRTLNQCMKQEVAHLLSLGTGDAVESPSTQHLIMENVP